MDKRSAQNAVAENDVVSFCCRCPGNIFLAEMHPICCTALEKRLNVIAIGNLAKRLVGKVAVGSREKFERFKGGAVYLKGFNTETAFQKEQSKLVSPLSAAAGRIETVQAFVKPFLVFP